MKGVEDINRILIAGAALLAAAVALQAVAVWRMHYVSITVDVAWIDNTTESRNFKGAISAERAWVGAASMDQITAVTIPHIRNREIPLMGRYGKSEQLVAILLSVAALSLLCSGYVRDGRRRKEEGKRERHAMAAHCAGWTISQPSRPGL